MSVTFRPAKALWPAHRIDAVEVVKAGRCVHFSKLTDLFGALAKAERAGPLREKIRFFCRFALLIVDEIG
jgi:DNA replication protein DnaC